MLVHVSHCLFAMLPYMRRDSQPIHLLLRVFQPFAKQVVALRVLFYQKFSFLVPVLMPVPRSVVHNEVKQVLHSCDVVLAFELKPDDLIVFFIVSVIFLLLYVKQVIALNELNQNRPKNLASSENFPILIVLNTQAPLLSIDFRNYWLLVEYENYDIFEHRYVHLELPQIIEVLLVPHGWERHVLLPHIPV